MKLVHMWYRMIFFKQKTAYEKRISDWSSDVCSTDLYQGGTTWQKRLLRDIGDNAQVAKLIASYTDDALAALMTNLGGHCLETLTDAFDRAADDVPTMFIAYPIKGFGLPFAGHKDNHAGLMNPTQIAALRAPVGIDLKSTRLNS